MNRFKFSARLGIFLVVSNIGVAYAAAPQAGKATGASPFFFGGTYDNASFYRAESPTCMTIDFINSKIDSLHKLNPAALLKFSANSAKTSKESTKTTSVTTSIFWGLSSETTTYTTSTQTDNYSLSVNYTNNYATTVYIGESIPVIEAGFTPEARKLYDSIGTAIANNNTELTSTNYKKFRQMCGTGIITKLDATAKFDFTLIFNFSSTIEKDGAVKIAGISTFNDALKLVANRGQVRPDTKIDFSLNIVATQLGGDPEQLANLLSKYATKAKTTDSSSFLMSTFKADSGTLRRDGNTFSLACKMGVGPTNSCTELINALTTYAGKIEGQLTTDNLYYTNPGEKQYLIEAKGASYTKNVNVNKDEQNKLWGQYQRDEKGYRYVTRYLNYLQNIESKDVIGSLTQITDLDKSTYKQGLSDLIASLEKVKVEYADVLALYGTPEVKKLIKNCFANVTASCSASSADVLSRRRDKFADEAVTDNLVHYLMNSKYMNNFYTRPRESVRCNIMPISKIDQGFYLADCENYAVVEKPKFVMQIFHNNEKLDIHSFGYAIGKNIFSYSDYRDNSGASIHDIPDVNDTQGGEIFSHPVPNIARHTYMGTMGVTISPKIIPDEKPKDAEYWKKEMLKARAGDYDRVELPSYVIQKRMPVNLEQLSENQ